MKLSSSLSFIHGYVGRVGGFLCLFQIAKEVFV